uniref:MYND-type domain-containing protein n=1 Tax=Anopheles maculatus TaxID=74869 RepID=A0A182ST12_9DIPT
MNGSGSGLYEQNAQKRGSVSNNASGIGGMGGSLIEPIPLMLGMFNACTFCHKGGASYQCFVCGSFYCGEQCQRADWPGHIIQCLPRLVRIHSGFVPSETQRIAFPPPQIPQMHGNNNHPLPKDGLKQQVPKKQNGPSQEFAANMAIKSPIKSTERKPNRDETLAKLTPPSNVPTNVLKNLALKRHQEQEASTSKAESPKPETSTVKNEATTANDKASKLAKRVQQKATVSPKGTIQYSSFPVEGENVKISYVSDNVLFVYRSGQEANGQANRYLDLIKRSVECARGVEQLLSTAPKPTDIVFAPFDGDHYRAVVKSVDGPMATVFYPDFGNTQTVEWNRMKTIPDRTIQYGMCYTHPVKIEGVSDFSPLVKQYLEEMLEMEEFELIKFIECDLPLGEDVQLMVVEASELNVSNQLSVILKTDSLAFAQMMNECDQYGNKDPHPYQPKGENEVFLVQFEGVWCRALLAGLGEEVQYYLLDLGIIRVLDEKPKCRRLPTGLSRKIFVCECIVDNLEALGEFAKEENNDMLRGKTLNAKVYQHTDDEGETMHVKVKAIN